MPTHEYDYFISYSHEDRDAIVIPLVRGLQGVGIAVWFDEQELLLGDSIVERLQNGLRRSFAAIAVISHSYLQRDWTKKELHFFLSSERHANRLLPIWHRLDPGTISSLSPLLADRLGASSSLPVDELVGRLQAYLRRRPQPPLRDYSEPDLMQLEAKLFAWLTAPQEPSANAFKGRRVAIVDDHSVVLQGICSIFENHGATTEGFASSLEIKKRLEEASFDLITLDISMPGESGIAAGRFHSHGVPIPFIFLTMHTEDAWGFTVTSEIDHAGYVVKNVALDSLLVRAEDLLNPSGIYTACIDAAHLGIASYRRLANARVAFGCVADFVGGSGVLGEAIRHKLRHVIRDFCASLAADEPAPRPAFRLESQVITLARVAERARRGARLEATLERFIVTYLQDIKFIRQNLRFEVALPDFEFDSPESNQPSIVLRVCLMELLDNALESTSDSIDLSVLGRRLDSIGEYAVLIRNSGPAIPEVDVQHLFAHGFSTKGRSRGLGLSLIRALAMTHHASISLNSRDPVEFIMKLPIRPGSIRE